MKDTTQYAISMNELVECLSTAIELINPVVAGHNRRVALLSKQIAKVMGFSDSEIEEIYYAGLLHDIGAAPLSIVEKEQLLQFDVDDPFKHCMIGYLLVRTYKPFTNIAKIILYHHEYWMNGKNKGYLGEQIPFASFIIHLADRIDILVNHNKNILLQRKDIVDYIAHKVGSVFAPKAVEALRVLEDKESFWLSSSFENLFIKSTDSISQKHMISIDELEEFTRLVSLVIDFKSRFTASHSRGVSAVSQMLGRLKGYSEEKSTELSIAGNLHDIGKLVVPNEILEKNGRLNREEQAYIHSHSYYSYQILAQVEELRDIARYASQHHEKLDGSGYPYHIENGELSDESRLLAVADVFTALTEDRPYRLGLGMDDVVTIIGRMADERELDSSYVELLRINYGIINSVRDESQTDAIRKYSSFWNNLNNMLDTTQCELHTA
jgi:HD-GYP domain-containing protein (c-di-GMP phosphodiesterase class II)